MNFTPAPTLISTVISLFRKHTSQPTFTPVAPLIPTQVYITHNTTVHVNSSLVPAHDPTINQQTAFDKNLKRKDCLSSLHAITEVSEKKQHCDQFPETPHAPHPQHMTFILPIHHCNTAELVSAGSLWNDLSSVSEVSPDGLPKQTTSTRVSTEDGVPPLAEPKTLARALFFFGFVCPAFWIVGCIIIWIPLRTTRDWEMGRDSIEIEWRCLVIRESELRWARRCLLALLSEALVVLLVFVIVKWGIKVQS